MRIVIVIIALFVLFFLLSEFYRRTKLLRRFNMSLQGGRTNKLSHKTSLRTVDDMKIPKRFPQVGVLTNDIIHKIPIEQFVWLEKTDGEHVNVIIFNKRAYTLDKEHQPVQSHKELYLPVQQQRKPQKHGLVLNMKNVKRLFSHAWTNFAN